jgi:hypothetical protein
MKNEQLLRAMGDVDERFIAEAAPGPKRHRNGAWVKWAAAVCACLAVCAAVVLPRLERGSRLPRWIHLSKETTATVEVADGELPPYGAKNCLVYFSEEEMFAMEDMYIFHGTVTDITNLKIDFNGEQEVFCVVTIQVEKVFKGDIPVGEPIRMLVCCPINPDGRPTAEDHGVIAQVKVGMEGIFMPVICDENAIWGENGATLIMSDVAQCVLGDGVRWVFLETDRGLTYLSPAYPGARGSNTLDDIEAYVVRMLNRHL